MQYRVQKIAHPAKAGDGTEKCVRRKIHAAALAGPCGGFCARRDCMSSPCMCSAAMPSGARACSGPGVCVQRQGWSSSGVRQHSWGKVLPAMLRGYAFRGTGIQSKGRVSLDQLQSSERMKMGDFNPHVVGGFSLLVIGFRSVSSRTGRAISFFQECKRVKNLAVNYATTCLFPIC